MAKTTKNSEQRNILSLPNAASHRHLIEAAKSLQLAESAAVEVEFEFLRGELPNSISFSRKRSFEDKFREELWQATNRHRRGIKKLEAEYRARWFVWRSALSVSLISGVPAITVLEERKFSDERSVAIWISYTTGNIPFYHIGKVIDRDRTTVMHSFRRVEAQIEAGQGKLHSILEDVLNLEDQQLCP